MCRARCTARPGEGALRQPHGACVRLLQALRLLPAGAAFWHYLLCCRHQSKAPSRMLHRRKGSMSLHGCNSNCVQVDGKSSVACYLMALDKCYASLCEKFERCRSNFERQRRLARSSSGSAKGSTGGLLTLL